LAKTVTLSFRESACRNALKQNESDYFLSCFTSWSERTNIATANHVRLATMAATAPRECAGGEEFRPLVERLAVSREGIVGAGFLAVGLGGFL
jgi:hypothetical protein